MNKIKKGDLRPVWSATLYDGAVPVDLTAASGVEVHMVLPSGTAIQRTATSFDGNGVVTMAWQSGDTDVAGDILSEVEVTWPIGKPQTFPPDDSYLVTRVYEDLE